MHITTTTDDEAAIILNRNKSGGAHNGLWAMQMVPASTSLAWNTGGGSLLTLDTAGNLTVAANLYVSSNSIYSVANRSLNLIATTGNGIVFQSAAAVLGYINTVELHSYGLINATGYVNSAPSAVYANPWLGTPTTSRAQNTVYQNLTGKTISIYASVVVKGFGGLNYSAVASIGTTSTPAIQVAEFTNSTIDQVVNINFNVPVNWYYTIANSSSGGIVVWTEQVL
jgi:hypothetical protein